MSNELETTPIHLIKPELHWVGRILGCDVYIDTKDPKKRDVAEKVLTKALESLKNTGGQG